MNIKQAKEQIQNAMRAYFTKNEYGDYAIPIERQRPIFLMGPPGIGKTAIMEQVAAELGVGLVSYSMTHHTRQSALGLPFITHKVYGGREYDVSEYTMSEIIASVYDMMESTGLKEGILFLDDVYILGLTLDVSEMDLWWLLSYRSKQIATRKLPINNKIIYLDIDLNTSRNREAECKRRRKLLEAFDVKCVSCKGDTYTEQYDYACNWLKTHIK